MLDGLILLQERIQRGEGHNQVAIRVEAAEKKAKKLGREFEPPLVSIRPIGQAHPAKTEESK